MAKLFLSLFSIFTNRAETLATRVIMRSCAARLDTRAGPFLAVPLRYRSQRRRGDLCDSTCTWRRRRISISIRIRGRTIAGVLLPDSTNVNHTLVKDGWCWWYRKYAPGNAVLERLEKEAREAQKGLRADPHPVPPWEWRKKGRN